MRPECGLLLFMKQPTFWSHLQTPNNLVGQWTLYTYYTTHERIRDKAYRGILAVVRVKTKGKTNF